MGFCDPSQRVDERRANRPRAMKITNSPDRSIEWDSEKPAATIIVHVQSFATPVCSMNKHRSLSVSPRKSVVSIVTSKECVVERISKFAQRASAQPLQRPLQGHGSRLTPMKEIFAAGTTSQRSKRVKIDREQRGRFRRSASNRRTHDNDKEALSRKPIGLEMNLCGRSLLSLLFGRYSRAPASKRGSASISGSLWRTNEREDRQKDLPQGSSLPFDAAPAA